MEGPKTVSSGTVVVVVSLVTALSVLGGAATYASFTDSESASATIQAAASFDGAPPGPEAFDDQDGDGVWDSGEPTYTRGQISGFDDPSVNLVIPADVGTIVTGSITARSITSASPILGGSVSLTATSGDISLASSVGAFGSVDISAAGTLDLRGASVTSGFSNVALEANGDAILDSASLSARTATTVDLVTGATLHVSGTSIDDRDDRLAYCPGVAVDPSRSDVFQRC